MTGRYGYFNISYTAVAISIVKKKTFSMEFVTIKPRHPSGLEKNEIWVEKPSNGSSASHKHKLRPNFKYSVCSAFL